MPARTERPRPAARGGPHGGRYDRVVHLDADTLVVGPLFPLLRLDLAAAPLWTPPPRAARSESPQRPAAAGVWETGALILRPDAGEYERLRVLAAGRPDPGAGRPAEEELGRLLEMAFGSRRGELGQTECADAADLARDPGLWARRGAKGGPSVVLYPAPGPWGCREEEAKGAGGGPCRAWRELEALVRCELTLVTAYYKIPSKCPAAAYEMWLQGLLALDACLVVVTSPASMGLFRGRDPRYTRLVAAELDAAAGRLNRSAAFWAAQHGLDPEARIHKGPQLYMVWNLKPLVLGDAVARNAFGSRYFFWIDVGYLRHRMCDGRTLQTAPPQVVEYLFFGGEFGGLRKRVCART